MNENEVLIKIITVLKNDGVEAARKELQSLKKETEAASGAGQILARVEDLLNEKTGKGAEALGVFARVLQGGAGAANLMKGAVTGLDTALSLSLPHIQLVLMGLNLLLAAWSAIKSHAEASAKAAEEAAEKERKAIEEAAEAAKKKVEDLNRVRLDAAKDAADALKASLKAAADEAARTRKAFDELADTRAKNALAGLDLAVARGDMGEDEAERKRTEISQAAREEAAARERTDLAEEEKRLNATADEKTTASQAAFQRLRELKDAADEADAAVAAAEGNLVATRRAVGEEIQMSYGTRYRELVKEGPGRIAAAEKAIEDAKAKRDRIAERRDKASVRASAARAEMEAAVAARDARAPEIAHRRAVLDEEADTWSKERDTASLAAYNAAERAAAANAAGRYADRAAGIGGGEYDTAILAEQQLQALFDEAAEELADFPEELGKVVDAVNKRRKELEEDDPTENKKRKGAGKRGDERVEMPSAVSEDPWTRIGAFSSAASGAQTAILKEQNAHLKQIEMYAKMLSRKGLQPAGVTL